MPKTIKVRLRMMVVGLLIWGFPAFLYYYPTWFPLKAPFPLAAGGTLHETFSVRTSEHYAVELACNAVGQFQETWQDFLNWKHYPTLDCDISLRLLHEGQEIHSARLSSLRPGHQSAGTFFWLMEFVDLPASGRCELLITNYTDISYLRPTAPTLQIKLFDLPVRHKGLGFWCSIGILIGGPVFLIGLVRFIISCFRLSDREPS